jgi:hypothetical protein
MTPLRQRMMEDLQLRGLAAKTQDSYLRAAVRGSWPSTTLAPALQMQVSQVARPHPGRGTTPVFSLPQE